MNVKHLLPLAAVTGLVTLAGCAAAPSLLALHGGDTGAATVVVSGWARATQATAADVSTVSISVAPLGGNPALGKHVDVGRAGLGAGTAATTFNQLAPGIWHITAEALGTTGSLGTASTDVRVVKDQTSEATLSIQLRPTSGLGLTTTIVEGSKSWTDFDAAAAETSDVGLRFAQATRLPSSGNWWTYELADIGTRSATYSVVGALAGEYLRVEQAGQTPYQFLLRMPNNDLTALPPSARLTATGSVAIKGTNTPYRRYHFQVTYPMSDGSNKLIAVDRWVTPVGICAEEATSSAPDGSGPATRSLRLLDYRVQ